MEKDFYLDERWLASYFEKDWSDHVFRSDFGNSPKFEYPAFATELLYSNYHEEFVDFLCEKIRNAEKSPKSLLEIGSSLGRTFYELCLKQPSIAQAHLVEPSKLLATTFEKIFCTVGISAYPMLFGNKEIQQVKFNTEKIRDGCATVNCTLANSSFRDVSLETKYDLVICSNVIDQCEEPLALLDVIKSTTAREGFLSISCTYQWNDRYVNSSLESITDISKLFGAEWTLLGKKDIDFKCRRSERNWLTFLSQVLVLQKN